MKPILDLALSKSVYIKVIDKPIKLNNKKEKY